ncbi:hypothetical protein ABT160_32940 [Streptomyces sp. NPDC001941]|uniref:hypothetical protein n=1 Tax=Streptomyces sp. NPDC001941 TaxID=3154659 RepID=UPI00331D432B
MPISWITGHGDRVEGELNPRGWGLLDFRPPAQTALCEGLETGCACERCRTAFEHDPRPFAAKMREHHEAKVSRRTLSEPSGTPETPVCRSLLVEGLPARITVRNGVFDAVTHDLSGLRDEAWFRSFTERLGLPETAVVEEWEGRLLWSAVQREDFTTYHGQWQKISAELADHIPDSHYPSGGRAGHRAPFVDVGLGSSLGFFWALNTDWDVQFSAAVATSIAYWADMASGVDAPTGNLAEIFDVLPSLASACSTGRTDNLSAMKVLAMEYLGAARATPLSGPLPALEDVWLSRLADVGARESCVLMTGCGAAFSDRRSDEDTRCLVAWGVIHDLYDLPRDVATRNTVNSVLWALFAGYTGHQIADWLRDTVALAARSGSCAAKLLLCTAFVHVANPRWAVSGVALADRLRWPSAPPLHPAADKPLPAYIRHPQSLNDLGEPACICVETEVSRALGTAALTALDGTVPRFTGSAARLEAHDTGMSALITQDWDTLVDLSRTAWSTFLHDLDRIADWTDNS